MPDDRPAWRRLVYPETAGAYKLALGLVSIGTLAAFALLLWFFGRG